mmetsp:Transcript_19654/g.35512  ORF Transcript_19654/g.35512 Transcript_19654/m.35512 type:complete len:267 (-) Transcript_19654:17-817(-)
MLTPGCSCHLEVEHVEVREERGHRVAIVRLDNTGEERNAARNLGLGKEAHDADHRKAPVVDLGDKTLGLLLRRRLGREVERVEQVERDRVRDLHVRVVHERRVHARLAALHVVGVERALAPELEERDDRDDLPLSGERDRIPLRLRRAARVRERVALQSLRPRELNSVGAREVADKRSHRNTAVLDLGVAQVANGAVLAQAPEVDLSNAERIPEARGERVGVGLGKGDQVVLGGGELHRGLGRGLRREGRGGAEGKGEDNSGELHL